MRTYLAAFGLFMQRHARVIAWLQWVVVAFYLFLLVIPAFSTLPPRGAHILSNLVLFAQFAFWGIWWPFVILSMLLLGRVWCGIFCPEGTLAQWSSQWRSRSAGSHNPAYHKTIPRWIKWRGWPALAFILTTLYGQLISVYDYAQAVLLILGGSTVAAMVVGFLYGRNNRVWCRYLCPVAGVFNMLSRLAPLSFKTDGAAWRTYKGKLAHHPVCPPMISYRHLQGVSACHMCGHCAGYRDAVTLTPRHPNEEVVLYGHKKTCVWEMRLLLYGMIGVAIGAFSWTVSPWFVFFKQKLAVFLVQNGILWPLESGGYWWILTNYPQYNDHFNWLDGFCISFYILGSGVIFGSFLSGSLSLMVCLNRQDSILKRHLAQAYLPIAAAGLFLGLTATTLNLLRYSSVSVSGVSEGRMVILAGAVLWSLALGRGILARYPCPRPRYFLCLFFFSITLVPLVGTWYFIFWG